MGEWGEINSANELSFNKTVVVDKSNGMLGINSQPTVGISGEIDQTLFKPILNKPEEKSFKQLSNDLKAESGRSNSESVNYLALSLERKRVDPLSSVVLCVIGMPLAFSLGRKSTVAALSMAVLLGLTYWVLNSFFFYFGVRDAIPIFVAAWLPPAIYLAAGIYILTRSRT